MFQAANQIISKLKLNTLLDMRGATPSAGPEIRLRMQNKTADYTVKLLDSGTVFFNYGDTGAINYTLSSVPKVGFFAIFVNMVDQNMTITAGTVDTLYTYNDLAADSVAISTSSQKIGGAILVFSDGNKYVAINISSNTMTVNT